jgi:hypothetical protein
MESIQGNVHVVAKIEERNQDAKHKVINSTIERADIKAKRL